MNEADFQELKRRYPTYAKFFHWVSPSGQLKEGYYRRIPRTYYDRRLRPASQLRCQLALAEASHNSFGQKGFREGLPVVTYNIKKAIEGKKFREPAWKRALNELRQMLKVEEAVVEA